MDGSSPATKADIASIMKVLQDMYGEMRDMHANLRRCDDEILTVLINVDKRLTGSAKDHERRIVWLENQVA